jgi:hypothetical protein
MVQDTQRTAMGEQIDQGIAQLAKYYSIPDRKLAQGCAFDNIDEMVSISL